MNSWKMNSIANYALRRSISQSLNIPITDVYKVVKDINYNNSDIIELHNGKKYKLVLKEI